MAKTIIARVEQAIKSFTFTNFAFTPLQKPLTIESYEKWLQNGMHADMTYLEEHLPAKKDSTSQWPWAKSVIVIAQNYLPHPAPLKNLLPLSLAKIAKYAQGQDYHHWFKQTLEQLAYLLKEQFPQEEFLAITDSSPFLERNWAYESGLGWFGKNTCLINPEYGSFHFLGEVLTSLELPPQREKVHDFCGKCTKCIDACPTQALSSDKTLDANKCIAYWTIETRKTPPPSLLPHFGSWLFGCDICQDVCPWNQKAFSLPKTQDKKLNATDIVDLCKDLKWLLELSNKQLLRNLKGTPLMRAGPNGIKKNAIQMAGHYKLKIMKPLINNYIEHPVLSEVSQWALAQFEIPDNIRNYE